MMIIVKCYECGSEDCPGYGSFPDHNRSRFHYTCQDCGHKGYMQADRRTEYGLEEWT